MLLGLAGCGASARPSHPPESTPTLKVHLDSQSVLSTLPVVLARELGFFQDAHLHVKWTTQQDAQVTVGAAGSVWPIVGYVAIRPDFVLMSPVPDPHFRLRALNALPMVYAAKLKPDRALLEKILRAHRAQVTQWNSLTFSQIESLWKRRHLPWVVVTLHQASILRSLDPHSAVLAWLGASTGPIPSTVVTAPVDNLDVVHFLDALNLALWYLHTTAPRTVASDLSGQGPHQLWTSTIKAALHYQYWPATTFPDSLSYNRSRTLWTPTWPIYTEGVNRQPAHQALLDSGA